MDNQASIGLHLRLGFVETGRMPEVGYKFGRWLDLILMQRRLCRRSGRVAARVLAVVVDVARVDPLDR